MKKNYFLFFAFLLIAYISPKNAWAAVDISVDRYLAEMQISASVKNELKNDNVNLTNVIPLNIPQGSSERSIASKIVGHSIDRAIHSQDFRASYLGKKTTVVESSLNPKISIKTTKSNSKMEVNFLAAEKKATLNYKGPIDATVSYYVGQQQLQVHLGKSFNGTTTVNYDVLIKGDETLNQVSYNYHF